MNKSYYRSENAATRIIDFMCTFISYMSSQPIELVKN
jgi:hypothetical protein